MSGEVAADLGRLADALGHRFADPALLTAAVTHPSMMGLERGRTRGGAGTPYERLEFLGDRVLGLVVAEWLLERFPKEREGDLAKRHAALVKRDSLAKVAGAIELGGYLRLSPGEVSGGGRSNATILADACEAVIGALFLDGGLEPARAFIRNAWAGMIERSVPPPLDPKTALQEWAQGRGLALPVYEVVEQTGTAHEPLFRVQVSVAGEPPVIGSGPSKRVAEKQAAMLLLKQVGAAFDD